MNRLSRVCICCLVGGLPSILVAQETSGTSGVMPVETSGSATVVIPSTTAIVTGSSAEPLAVSGTSKVDVNVVGAVARAGRISIAREAGVVGALSAAGWFTDMSEQKKVKVLRKEAAGGSRIIFLNIPLILNGERPDILLQAEDTLVVSERIVNF